MEMWMYWTTAIIFTCMGWFMRGGETSFRQSKANTQQVIDTLIEMGYVKVEGEGDEAEMIRWPTEDEEL